MCQNGELEAQIVELRREMSDLKLKMNLKIKAFTEFHTHTLGGKVVWEFPPEMLKKILASAKQAIERNKAVNKDFNEPLTISDDLKITMTPAEIKLR